MATRANGGRLRVGVDVRAGRAVQEASINSGAEGPWARTSTPRAQRPGSGGSTRQDHRLQAKRPDPNGAKTSSGWKPERALRITGDHVVGIDFSQGEFQSVLRLKEGQAVTFDGWDDWRIKRARATSGWSAECTPAGRNLEARHRHGPSRARAR